MSDPNNGPPPAYTISRPVASLTRVNPRSLRWVVFFWAALGAVWAGSYSVKRLRHRNDEFETSKMSLFDLIVAIVYMACLAIEIVGLVGAFVNKAIIVRIYSLASIGGVALVACGGIIQIINNYVNKDAIIIQCVHFADDIIRNKEDACRSAWRRQVWWDVVWTIAVIFFASVSSMFALAYARQLRNPGAFGSGGVSASPPHQYDASAVPLQTWQSHPAPPPDYVPPYPGPPPNEPSYGQADAKSSSNSGFVSHTAEDAAWQASLDASERREWEQHEANQLSQQGLDAANRHGVNEEEDEAWERAKREASTAHIGGGAQNNPFAPGNTNAEGGRRGENDEGGRIV